MISNVKNLLLSNNQSLKYVEKQGISNDMIYEGSFTLWECTSELLNHLCASSIQFKDKNVLDLGCGLGLLGIFALVNGANVLFHDYNQQTIEILQTNAGLNNISQSLQFQYGDWKNFDVSNHQNQFDYILGSELIYKEENYGLICNIIKNCLSHSGKAIICNKQYYFGVGGNTNDFEDYCDKQNLKIEEAKAINNKNSAKKMIHYISK